MRIEKGRHRAEFCDSLSIRLRQEVSRAQEAWGNRVVITGETNSELDTQHLQMHAWLAVRTIQKEALETYSSTWRVQQAKDVDRLLVF